MLPEGQVSGEIEDGSQGPVDVVLADVSSSCEVGTVSGELETFMEDQRHPCRLGTL